MGISLVFLAAGAFAQAQPTIDGIEARLFNSKTGNFSENILAAGSPELGNVPSGEFASVSTFIIVKVAFGPKAAKPANATVRLAASEGPTQPFASKQARKPLLNAVSKLGPVDADGNTYVGFWLNSTGCRSVQLKVTLTAFGKTATAAETLPFACYE